MRVLHVVPSYFPALRYGGPVVSVHGLCRALVEHGHEVDVFTTLVDGENDMDIAAGERIDRDGVGVYYFPVVVMRRWYFSPALAAHLRRVVADYDLVHLHALFLHPVSSAARIAKRAGVPYVLSPRGMLVQALFAQRSRWIKTLWMRLIGRAMLENAAAVHVTSATERADVDAFGLTLRTVVDIPNGIDASALSHASSKVGLQRDDVVRDPALVLFLGRLSWKKQIDRLIEAMVDCEQLRLAIVGNDDEHLLPELRAQAQRLGIDSRIEFAGPAHAQARDEWYARAGMFVLPSRSENFANTVLEAMAAGCAVIVSAGVGLSQVVSSSHCGIVCADTPQALAQAMQQLSGDPEAAAQMGARGQATVREGFLWPQVATRMSRAYADLVRKGAADDA